MIPFNVDWITSGNTQKLRQKLFDRTRANQNKVGKIIFLTVKLYSILQGRFIKTKGLKNGSTVFVKHDLFILNLTNFFIKGLIVIIFRGSGQVGRTGVT